MALAQRMNRCKYVFVLVACMLVTSTWLTGCAIPITYHDAATYKNLTDLKAEVMMLVEMFDAKPFAANEAAIADITLKFRKAYEYEKGKGKPNSDTMRQFDEIWKLLNEDIKDYREGGSAAQGRYLAVVFALKSHGVARVITGWDMDKAEIRYWRKHRG